MNRRTDKPELEIAAILADLLPDEYHIEVYNLTPSDRPGPEVPPLASVGGKKSARSRLQRKVSGSV